MNLKMTETAIPQLSKNLCCIIGHEDARAMAHLLRRIAAVRMAAGIITEGECAWMGRSLPPPAWPSWREMAEAECQVLLAQGCRRIFLTLTPQQISAGWAEGLSCGRAILCGLEPEDDAAAVERYLTACAGALTVNLDDVAAGSIARRWRGPLFGYGERRPEAALWGGGMACRPGCVTLEAVAGASIARVRLRQPGSYEPYTALGALAWGLAEGISLEASAAQVNAAPPVPGYFEPLTLEGGGEALLYRRPVRPVQLERLLALAGQLQAEGARTALLLSLTGTRSDGALRRMAEEAQCPVLLCPGVGRGRPDFWRTALARGLSEAEGGFLLCAGQADWKRLLLRCRKP